MCRRTEEEVGPTDLLRKVNRNYIVLRLGICVLKILRVHFHTQVYLHRFENRFCSRHMTLQLKSLDHEGIVPVTKTRYSNQLRQIIWISLFRC